MTFQEPLRQARAFITAERGLVAPLSISEEELNPGAQDDLSIQTYPLESTKSCYAIDYEYSDDSSRSEFDFFEDAKQRTLHIGYIPTNIGQNSVLIPVHFFVVAAVILQRKNRKLMLWGQPELQRGILIEKSLVPDQEALARFEHSGLTIVDTQAVGGDYYDLRRRALREAKDRRLAAENCIIERWRVSDEASSHFLIVDGTLMNLRNEKNVERCVGVSKSFGSRYFSVSDYNRILQMKPFERSWTFRFHSIEEGDDPRLGGRERVSWYLRLRSGSHADPEFGLIRVEISQRHMARAPDLANRFSRSLLSERLPTAYPAPRWHNHLYPIQACENYLASIMPSIDTINACMKG